MVARIAVISSFVFLLAGIFFWILAEVRQDFSLMVFRNISFLGFYLIHFVLLAIKSRFIRIPKFVVPAFIGILIALAGGYLIYEFYPSGETIFVTGLAVMFITYTVWVILKRPTFFSDFLKWVWVTGLCLSLADMSYDLIRGPWLDIIWFGAFVLLGIYNARDAFEEKA